MKTETELTPAIRYKVPVECQNGHKSYYEYELYGIGESKLISSGSQNNIECTCSKFSFREGWGKSGSIEILEYANHVKKEEPKSKFEELYGKLSPEAKLQGEIDLLKQTIEHLERKDKEELEKCFDAGFNHGQDCYDFDGVNKLITTPTFKEWYKENIKQNE